MGTKKELAAAIVAIGMGTLTACGASTPAVGELGDERGADVPRLGGPLGALVVLFERAPEGEVLQRLPLARRERVELGLPAGAQRHDEDRVERDALGRPYGVEVDPGRVVVGRGDRRTRRLDDGALWPTSFAVVEVTDAVIARIRDLVAAAVA